MADDAINRIRLEIERHRKNLDALEKTLAILESGGGNDKRGGNQTIGVNRQDLAAGAASPRSGSSKGGTMVEMIQRVLSKSDVPLTIKEIYKRLLHDEDVKFAEATLRSKVYTAAQTGKIMKAGVGQFTNVK